MALHLLLYLSDLTEGLFSLQWCSFSAASVSMSALDIKYLVSLEILCFLWELPCSETHQEWGKHSWPLWKTICDEEFRRREVEKTTTSNGPLSVSVLLNCTGANEEYYSESKLSDWSRHIGQGNACKSSQWDWLNIPKSLGFFAN